MAKKKTTKQVRAIDRIIKFQIDDGIESLTIGGKTDLADLEIDKKDNVILHLNADADKINEIKSLVPFITIKQKSSGKDPDKKKSVELIQDLQEFALELAEDSKQLAEIIKAESSITLDLSQLITRLNTMVDNIDTAQRTADRAERKAIENAEKLEKISPTKYLGLYPDRLHDSELAESDYINIDKLLLGEGLQLEELNPEKNFYLLKTYNVEEPRTAVQSLSQNVLLDDDLKIVIVDYNDHFILKFIQQGNMYGGLAVITGESYSGGGKSMNHRFDLTLPNYVENTTLSIPLINNTGYPVLVLDVIDKAISVSQYSKHSMGGIIPTTEFILKKKLF